MQVGEVLFTLLQECIKHHQIVNLGVAGSLPAATPPSSSPGGGPHPTERKLCARERSTPSRTAGPPRSGRGRTSRTGSNERGSSSRLLAPRSPRRAGAGPGAGHCGKGVEDAAWEDLRQALRVRRQQGGKGGVGLG